MMAGKTTLKQKPGKKHAILVEETADGLIGLTNGTFNVQLGPAETEVDIDDIPIKVDDLDHIKLTEKQCSVCKQSFYIEFDPSAHIKGCPFCGHGLSTHSKCAPMLNNRELFSKEVCSKCDARFVCKQDRHATSECASLLLWRKQHGT